MTTIDTIRTTITARRARSAIRSINWRYLPVLLLRLALLAVAGSIFPVALYLWAVGLV